MKKFILYVLNLLAAIMPFGVVIGHFVPMWVTFVLALVFYWLSGIFIVACGTVNILIAIVGFYFAFTEFPIWFAILYSICVVPFLYNIARTFIRGVK